MNYISNVSFKAKLISPSTVVVKSADGKKNMVAASFVKLSQRDLPQLDSFASECLNSDLAKKINYNLNNESGSENRHYFAMTLQKENLHELDPQKIIGMAETTLKNGVLYLDYLQTATKESFMNGRYSYIGTSMISGIINQAKKLKTECKAKEARAWETEICTKRTERGSESRA